MFITLEKDAILLGNLKIKKTMIMKKKKEFRVETIVAMDTLGADMMSMVLGGSNEEGDCGKNILICTKKDCSRNNYCSCNGGCLWNSCFCNGLKCYYNYIVVD